MGTNDDVKAETGRMMGAIPHWNKFQCFLAPKTVKWKKKMPHILQITKISKKKAYML